MNRTLVARRAHLEPARSIRPANAVVVCLSIIGCAWFLPASASAQSAFLRPGTLPAIDQRTQAAIIDSVCTVMDTMYVLPDVAAKTVSRWRKEFKRGGYRELTDPVTFVQKLADDANAVYVNKHFGMAVMRPFDPAIDGEKEVDPREAERAQRAMRRQNYGFQKVEVLPGNIGYLKLNQFINTDRAGGTAIGAMNFLSSTDALIFDVRTNPGGDASMIRLLTSYLFDEQQHLIDWYVRDLEETIQSWTLDYVPGTRLSKVPVYVLTSDFTGSAAEEFTFDLQHLKRATVVGDTTAGAGHTVNAVFIHFDGFRVGMRVPYGNAVDPKTGKGWEGTGVIPDIAVAADRALSVAQLDALKRLREGAKDREDSLSVAWTMQDLESRANPVSLDTSALGEYEGSYGPRRVFMEGAGLLYQREGGPKMALTPMAKDLFRVGELDYFRVRFDRDAAGRIVSLSGLYDNGRVEPNPKAE